MDRDRDPPFAVLGPLIWRPEDVARTVLYTTSLRGPRFATGLARYSLSIQVAAQILKKTRKKPIHETYQGPLELSILHIPEVPEKVDGFGESGQVVDRKGSCHLQLRGASNTFFYASS